MDVARERSKRLRHDFIQFPVSMCPVGKEQIHEFYLQEHYVIVTVKQIARN